MVLQRAPVRARIWGYGFNVGDTVTVSISSVGEYQTTTVEGNDTMRFDIVYMMLCYCIIITLIL